MFLDGNEKQRAARRMVNGELAHKYGESLCMEAKRGKEEEGKSTACRIHVSH